MVKFRDPGAQAEFERQGFVVRRILTDEEVREARQRLDAAGMGRSFERNDWEDSYYNSMFEREAGFQGRFRKLMGELFHPRLDELVQDGRHFETSLLYKPAQSRDLKLHQHVPLTEKPFAPSIFCWCPLEDTDETSGTLMVVPGSHLLLRFLRTLKTEEFFMDYREELTRRHAVPVRLKAGEAILFENSLLHGSYPNAGGGARPVVLTIILEKDAIHALYKHDGSGETVVVDGDYDEVQCHTMMPGGEEKISGRVLRRLPAWDDKPTLAEFEALLERGRKASEEVDPLAELRAERQARPKGRLASLLAGWNA